MSDLSAPLEMPAPSRIGAGGSIGPGVGLGVGTDVDAGLPGRGELRDAGACGTRGATVSFV